MLRRQIKRSGAALQACAGFDPETANAYVEQALSEKARTRYEEHLADCSACRRQVVALFRLMPQPEVAPQVLAPPEPRSFLARWFNFSTWQWGQWGLAAAGSVCAILLAVAAFRFVPLMLKPELKEANAVISEASPKPEEIAQNADVKQSKSAPAASALVPLETNLETRRVEQPMPAAKPLAHRDEAPVPAATLPPSQVGGGLPMSGLTLNQSLRNVIAGTVSDANGAMIANAQVRLLDPASQQARATTRTDASGQFGFLNIPQGNYLVEAQAPGFKTVQAPTVVQNLPRKAGEQLALTLEVGATNEIVSLADAGTRQSSTSVIKPPPGNPPPPPPPNEIKLSADKTEAERLAELAKSKPVATSKSAGNASEGRSQSQVQGQTSDQKKEAKDIATAPPARAAITMDGLRTRSNTEQNAAGAGEASNAPSNTTLNNRAASVADNKSPALPTRKIGEKTFRLERGVWLDNDYKPEDTLPRVQLKPNSREFKRILKDLPALKQFFNLGQVTVVWLGKIYEVRNKER